MEIIIKDEYRTSVLRKKGYREFKVINRNIHRYKSETCAILFTDNIQESFSKTKFKKETHFVFDENSIEVVIS